MNPKINCCHYRGDRPCVPHKRDGTICDNCAHYDPCSYRMLIIKLAADGDVLRTTCLLPSLRKKHPHAHITWLTEKSAEPLLVNNPLIDRIWAPPQKTSGAQAARCGAHDIRHTPSLRNLRRSIKD